MNRRRRKLLAVIRESGDAGPTACVYALADRKRPIEKSAKFRSRFSRSCIGNNHCAIRHPLQIPSEHGGFLCTRCDSNNKALCLPLRAGRRRKLCAQQRLIGFPIGRRIEVFEEPDFAGGQHRDRQSVAIEQAISG